MPALNPYQALLQKTYDRRIPLIAHWELTYACNLRCIHCYADKREGGEELSKTEILRIMDELAAAGCLFLTFTGGEVLTRPDAMELFEAAQARQFAFRVLTNGTLWDDEKARRIAACAPLSVEISVYAACAGPHDALTGVSGSHAAALRGAEAVLRSGVHVVLKYMLLRQNQEDYEGVRQLARNLGAGFSFDYLLIPSDAGRPTMSSLGLSPAEIADFIRSRGEDLTPPARLPNPDDPVCGAGSNALAITPAGEVLPCLGYRHPVGNLRRQSLAEIWQTPYLDRLHAARYYDYKQCAGCGSELFCARCPGVALAESGHPFAPSPSLCDAALAAKKAFDEITGQRSEKQEGR